MLFQYIGDDNEPPFATEVYGYKFELNGEPVDITDQAVIAKLVGNKTFKHEPPALIAPNQAVIPQEVAVEKLPENPLPSMAEVAKMAETPPQASKTLKIAGRK